MQVTVTYMLGCQPAPTRLHNIKKSLKNICITCNHLAGKRPFCQQQSTLSSLRLRSPQNSPCVILKATRPDPSKVRYSHTQVTNSIVGFFDSRPRTCHHPHLPLKHLEERLDLCNDQSRMQGSLRHSCSAQPAGPQLLGNVHG